MKITNRLNLPSAFVNLASDNEREITPKHYSVTTLLKPTREIILSRRHSDEIVRDVADMIWLIFGTAVHNILEHADKENVVELQMSQELANGYTLTGKCDLYNTETHTIEDYKTASVWKITFGDFEDWKLQGLMYAWLALKTGLVVDSIKFHALLKDWSPGDARRRGEGYPSHSVWTWEYKVTTSDIIWIETYILDRFAEIIANENADDPVLCTEKERWNSGTKYAVMKKGRKSALRVLDTLEEAQAYGEGDYIEEREGSNRKCNDYCNAREFCSYYNSFKEDI